MKVLKSDAMKRISSVLLLFALAGCNSKLDKLAGSEDSVTPVVSASEISFALVNQYVFAKSCTSCHDSAQAKGGINLERYETSAGFAQQIKSAVESGRMPMSPVPALSQRQKDLIILWAAQGAPNEAGGTPAPQLPPLEAKFASIKANVLKFKCDTCHNPTGSGKRFLFDTPGQLLKGQRVLVVPGKPEESVLLKVVSPGARRPMPPVRSGKKPLSPEEVEKVRAWIAAGAEADAQFEAIQNEIIQDRCAGCHTFEGSAENVPLDSLRDLIGGGTPFVIAGDAQKSVFAIVSKPGEGRSMPPVRSPAPPLTQEEWNVIKEWINNGASL